MEKKNQKNNGEGGEFIEEYLFGGVICLSDGQLHFSTGKPKYINLHHIEKFFDAEFWKGLDDIDKVRFEDLDEIWESKRYKGEGEGCFRHVNNGHAFYFCK